MPAVKLLDTASGRPRLDRYELVAELAAGGMATVFLARIAGVGGFQRFVAIKRLHPHLANEPEFVDMFLDEARLAARIHHPHVVPIVDIGQSDRGYYLVMEYVEGDTLARLLARASGRAEQLPPNIGIRIALDALAGLHAAHELHDESGEPLGLVHRDVSPQNILVGVDGNARITDFGVARATSRISSTRAGQLKGKLAYMAPEQARSQDVDRRADVFAMGTVLWEVLAGRRLFKADGEAETLSRVLFEPIPRLKDIGSQVPATLEAVVMRALERDRERRWASCADFAEAVERAGRLARWVATPREVATYVQSVLGHEVAQQREAVRAWIATSEASRTVLPDGIPQGPITVEYGPVSSLSSSAISVVTSPAMFPTSTPPPPSVQPGPPPPAPVASRRGRWVLAVGGLVALGFLGALLGGFVVSRRTARVRAAAAEAAAAAVEAPSLAAADEAPREPTTEPAAAGALPAPAASASATTASADEAAPEPEATAPPPAASEAPAAPPVARHAFVATPPAHPVAKATVEPAPPAAAPFVPATTPAKRPAAPAPVDDMARNPYR